MKPVLILAFLAAMTASCTKDSNQVTTSTGKPGTSPKNTGSPQSLSSSAYSQPISITLANQMISSYLASLSTQNYTSGLRSLSFNADTLRSYLNDTTNGRITTLKLMLAHREDYIVDNYGVDAGLDATALTLVIVGLDENEEYIYNKNNMVYDHARPCPANCGNSGNLLSILSDL
jgi:hypothetical protein